MRKRPVAAGLLSIVFALFTLAFLLLWTPSLLQLLDGLDAQHQFPRYGELVCRLDGLFQYGLAYAVLFMLCSMGLLFGRRWAWWFAAGWALSATVSVAVLFAQGELDSIGWLNGSSAVALAGVAALLVGLIMLRLVFHSSVRSFCLGPQIKMADFFALCGSALLWQLWHFLLIELMVGTPCLFRS